MSPLERFDHFEQRITRLNSHLNAFLEMRIEAARKEVEASEARWRAGEPLSSIDGWCVGAKANVAVAGLPRHAGIEAYRNDIAKVDAPVIANLKAAGAIILGNINMHEGALGATTDNEAFGRCHNPWREGLTPGGSSGGSGAAVAAGLCDMAIGSDTMGSVRIPAAYCGVQGHKPTTGLINTDGVLPLSHSLDHIGPLCRSVEALIQTLSAMSGNAMTMVDPGLLKDIRVGVWSGEDHIESSEAVMAGLEAGVHALTKAGAKCASFAPPEYGYGRSRRAGLIISELEGYQHHLPMLTANPQGFSDVFRGLLEWGAKNADAKLDEAVAHLADIRAAAKDIWAEFDIVLAPTAPQTAFEFDAAVPANQADFTAWANFAHLPSTAICTGLSKDGLPLSIQIIGPEGKDARTLEIARQLEQILGAPPVPLGFD